MTSFGDVTRWTEPYTLQYDPFAHFERHMRPETIEQKIRLIVADQTYAGKDFDRRADFVDDLGFDDLDVIEFAMELEAEFEIEVPDEVTESLRNLDAACRYVAGALTELGQAPASL